MQLDPRKWGECRWRSGPRSNTGPKGARLAGRVRPSALSLRGADAAGKLHGG